MTGSNVHDVHRAVINKDPVGYISLLERGSASGVGDGPRRGCANRRRGVGSALLAAGQAWAESRAHRRLIVEVQSKNLPAIRLVQKFGYEFCGYNDQYLPQSGCRFVLCKSIEVNSGRAILLEGLHD
jgi:RimJ/RimL family protein N-acetyltransferase